MKKKPCLIQYNLKCPKILFRVIIPDQPLPSREAKAAIIYIFFEGILALFLQTLEYALH